MLISSSKLPKSNYNCRVRPFPAASLFSGLDPAERNVIDSFNIMDQTTSKRILVVDDNSDAADISAELLELHGYQTAVAYAGLQGLQAARTFKPDAILLDLGMPGMDGYQVAEALRAVPDFDQVALIAFTAWGDVVTRQRVISTGFDEHVIKPANLDRILSAVRRAIDKRAQLMAASSL
jgi:CheY-like chemotaxis protein